MRRAPFLSAAVLASASIIMRPPVQAAPAEAALAIARSHVEDAAVNAVTFRAMDAFYPVEHVRHGRPSRLGQRLHRLAPEVAIGGDTASFDEALRGTFTNALLVMQDGAIVAERYFNGADSSSRFNSWSVAKSITSVLIGIAVDRGMIGSVTDPVERYLPELAQSAYAGVTIEQMLMMRDGTSYTEQADGEASTLQRAAVRSVYRNETRFTDVRGLGIERLNPPGAVFNYSTLTSSLLGRVVESASGMTLAAFTERYLWKPAGMEAPAFWVLDGTLPEGRAFGGSSFNATLRDYGRFGQMMLDGGRANGRQVVSRAWVEKSTRYTGPEAVIKGAPRGYQYQWWTMLGTDRFEAIGVHGQFVSIDPASRTVIVKLSHWPERGGAQYNRDTLALLDAIRDDLKKPVESGTP